MILARASEVGSPTNPPWAIIFLKKKRTVHLTSFLLRQVEPGPSQYITVDIPSFRVFRTFQIGIWGFQGISDRYSGFSGWVYRVFQILSEVPSIDVHVYILVLMVHHIF